MLSLTLIKKYKKYRLYGIHGAQAATYQIGGNNSL
jgi:hypothetical protein